MKEIPVRKIKQPPREPDYFGNFSIRDIRDLLKGKDLIHDLHRHDFYFILIIHKGKGLHVIDFVEYDVHDHSIFILRPGQVHNLELDAGSTGFLMEFDTAFYHPQEKLSKLRLIKAGNKNACDLETARTEKLLNVLNNIHVEFTEKQEGYPDAIRANMDIFFIEYLRHSRNTTDSENANGTYTQDRFEEFLDLLEKHIATQKQVSHYADMMKLSNYQLNAITKESVGKAASQLINEQSILEAKRFLLATTNQVKDIADKLGFEDISYFIRFFKKHTGLSPEAFRKRFQ